MSKRTILKTLTIYLLIGCFLVNNLVYTASSEALNSDVYGNNTESSGYNSIENSDQIETETPQSSETDFQDDPGTSSSENTNKDSPDEESSAFPEDPENEFSDNTEAEGAEETVTSQPSESLEDPDNSQIEDIGSEDTDKDAENTNGTPEYPENQETEYEGTEQAYEGENPEITETETLNHTETEDTESSGAETSENLENDLESDPEDQTKPKSSYHRSSGTSGYKVIKPKPATKNEAGIQPEPVVSPDLPKAHQEAPPSASVSLHGEKTDVIAGEDILLKLSAVNLITKPPMHVQVIIIPPSGMSVSSSEFVQSGAGQYTTTYELEPGQGRDIEVRIESYQPGNFNVKGRVVYYFGENIKNSEDYILELPIQVRDKAYLSEKAMPGFGIINAIFILGIFILRRNKM